MDLIKEYTAFTRKVEEFDFHMYKGVDEDGVEYVDLSLEVPGYADLETETTGCPAEAMADMMTTHLRRLAAANRPVVLTARPKILIVK